MKNRTLLAASLAILSTLPVPALAHTGMGEHAHFSSGFLHPLGGLDHLLAMFAVGLWSMQLHPHRALCVPLAFVSMMMLGFITSLHGLQLPWLETGITGSVLLLGLLLTTAVKLPVTAGAILAGIFAAFHGVAHGMEMDSSASAWTFGSGFMMATVLLHSAGLLCGLALQRTDKRYFGRIAGAVISATGLWLSLA